MAFQDLENSNYEGAPLTLYEFAIGNQSWCYNDSDTDIPYQSKLFYGVPISNEGITQSSDVANDTFEVTMPHNTELANLFVGMAPTGTMILTVRRRHHGDFDSPVVWSGIVKNGSRVDSVSFKIRAQAMLASLDRQGLRLAWGRNCPHALYDNRCQANPNLHSTTTTVNAKTGVDLYVNSVLSGMGAGATFAGGYIEFIHSQTSLLQRIAIESQNSGGTKLTLLGMTEGIESGQSITAFKGCERTINHCSVSFNNSIHYGGFPLLPDKSPFDGDPVF